MFLGLLIYKKFCSVVLLFDDVLWSVVSSIVCFLLLSVFLDVFSVTIIGMTCL